MHIIHKRIPIVAGKRIADEYGYDQVVIVARKVGADGQGGDTVSRGRHSVP